MAKIPDPSIFPITENLLELVPASISRFYLVLPVDRDIESKRLKVILPENFEEKTPDLLNMLSTVCRCNIEYDTTDEISLGSVIENAYANFHGKIDNCGVKFELECPKRWNQLSVSENPFVRYCSTCEKNVYFAHTYFELEAFAKENKCVAFCEDDGDATVGIVVPHSIVDEMAKLVEESMENLKDK